MRLAQWDGVPDGRTATVFAPQNRPFVTPRKQVLQRLQPLGASARLAPALCKNGCTATESPQYEPGSGLFLLAGQAQPALFNPNSALTQEDADDSW